MNNRTGVRRLPFRMLTIVDLFGLVVTTLIVTAVVIEPDSPSYILSLAVVSFGSWLVAAQFRSLSTILTHSRNYVIFAPVIAAIVVLTMRSITGDYYTLRGTLIFTLLWSAWLAAARGVRQRTLPQISILTFGSPAFLAEVKDLPNVNVRVVESPPEGFDGIDVVALDPVGFRGEEWLRWLMYADMAGVKLIAAPLIIETLTRQLPLEALQGRWAQYLLGARRPYADWKRAMDVALVVVFAPLILLTFAIVALAVYLDDRGPVLFWQDRVGQFKRPFRMVKIRSMRVDAECNGAAFATERDPRVTRVGAFIRRYRLDEVPQFWNVLKGDMSIVGPRPEQTEFSSEFEGKFPLYSLRYNLRPGITGWAQVMNGYAAGEDDNYDKLRYDLYYVRHVSPLLDAVIAIRTVAVLANGFGSR